MVIRRKQQHRSAKRRTGNNRRVPRPRIIQPRMRAATIPASVNTASRIRAVQPNSINVFTNTDRLLQIDLPKGTPKGSIIFDQVITPAIAVRLRQQAALYQKIRYRSLKFEIQTQVPTTTAGGYVCAYLHDPNMQVGSGEVALRNLTAVQGTQTSKMWQSVVMNVKPTDMQYYTQSGSDVRLFSPGRLVILSDGVPNEDVKITVLFHWTVELYKPALQRFINQLPLLTQNCTHLVSWGTTIRFTNWDPATNTLSPDPNGTDSDGTYLENQFSGLPPLTSIGSNTIFYKLPYPIRVDVDSPSRTVNAFFLGFRNVDGHYLAAFYDLPSTSRVLHVNDRRFETLQGMVLEPVVADEFTGTSVTSFLVTASPSVSVNQQSMICKTLSDNKPASSSTITTQIQSKLEALSLMWEQ